MSDKPIDIQYDKQATPNLSGVITPPTNETGNDSVREKLSKLVGDAMSNNPYFAAGGGLMILGTGLAVARSGIIKASRVLYRQMIGRLRDSVEGQIIRLVSNMDGQTSSKGI